MEVVSLGRKTTSDGFKQDDAEDGKGADLGLGLQGWAIHLTNIECYFVLIFRLMQAQYILSLLK